VEPELNINYKTYLLDQVKVLGFDPHQRSLYEDCSWIGYKCSENELSLTREGVKRRQTYLWGVGKTLRNHVTAHRPSKPSEPSSS